MSEGQEAQPPTKKRRLDPSIEIPVFCTEAPNYKCQFCHKEFSQFGLLEHLCECFPLVCDVMNFNMVACGLIRVDDLTTNLPTILSKQPQMAQPIFNIVSKFTPTTTVPTASNSEQSTQAVQSKSQQHQQFSTNAAPQPIPTPTPIANKHNPLLPVQMDVISKDFVEKGFCIGCRNYHKGEDKKHAKIFLSKPNEKPFLSINLCRFTLLRESVPKSHSEAEESLKLWLREAGVGNNIDENSKYECVLPTCPHHCSTSILLGKQGWNVDKCLKFCTVEHLLEWISKIGKHRDWDKFRGCGIDPLLVQKSYAAFKHKGNPTQVLHSDEEDEDTGMNK